MEHNEVIEHIRLITSSSDLPMNAVALAIDAGAAAVSIEDSSGIASNPVRSIESLIARLRPAQTHFMENAHATPRTHVEYETHPGQEAAFDEKIRAHAKACLAEEPGCLRLRCSVPIDDEGKPLANRFMANELFADEAALKEHRATPRWLRMSEVFKELLVQRRPVLSEADIQDK